MSAAVAAAPRRDWRARLRPWAPLLVLIALCAVIGAIAPAFLSLPNLVRILNAASIPLIVALGATFIILMGSVDLSLEGVVGLANGMVLMGVPPYVQTGVQGLLIIAAVALSLNRSRIRIVK